MTVPSSGELSLGKIRQELETSDYSAGPYTTNATSLSGSETGLYAVINTASPSYPNGIAPFAMSEWYSYDNAASAGLDVEYLVIAGGGGGGGVGSAGYGAAGGGGAGGYRSSVSGESSGGGASAESSLTLSTGVNYTVTIGAGGTGGLASTYSPSTKGNDSVFHTITSNGGGKGQEQFFTNNSGVDGGSGGGSYRSTSRGVGTANQGYDGGYDNTNTRDTGGGGGGAGGTGTINTYRVANGGNGVASSITGTSITRAGGGGGGLYLTGTNNGGTGGGGRGARSYNYNAIAGTINTGGGGGGSATKPTYVDGRDGQNGGSGIVILKYPNTYTISLGGTLSGSTTTVGANKVTQITSGTGTVSFS